VGKRKIIVNDVTFTWHMGTQRVAIRRLNDAGLPVEGRNPTLVDLSGPYWDWHSIERSKYKGGDFAIRPKLISLYIRREFFGEDVTVEFSDTITQ
jgi:hypothetical protein